MKYSSTSSSSFPLSFLLLASLVILLLPVHLVELASVHSPFTFETIANKTLHHRPNNNGYSVRVLDIGGLSSPSTAEGNNQDYYIYHKSDTQWNKYTQYLYVAVIEEENKDNNNKNNNQQRRGYLWKVNARTLVCRCIYNKLINSCWKYKYILYL